MAPEIKLGPPGLRSSMNKTVAETPDHDEAINKAIDIAEKKGNPHGID